jgi:hypothetical protein
MVVLNFDPKCSCNAQLAAERYATRQSLSIIFPVHPEPVEGFVPWSRNPEHPPSPQAVGERGRDENLEKGAAHQRMMTTQARVCFRKIFAKATCLMPQFTIYEPNSSKAARQSNCIKKSSFTNQIA